MPTLYLYYPEFLTFFAPSSDFTAYAEKQENDDDYGIEIEYEKVPCEDPTRDGLWSAILWKPTSEKYDGEQMREEFMTSSPFTIWWLGKMQKYEDVIPQCCNDAGGCSQCCSDNEDDD